MTNLNRVVFFLVAFIMNACTYDVIDNVVEEDSMAAKRSWSQSGTLQQGKGANIPVQAQFIEPSAYTVQFAFDDSAVVTGQARAQAEIDWSVDGNTVRRVVSIGNGVSVSGFGQAVSVVMRDLGQGGNGDPYLVTCNINPGTRPSQNQPPFLEVYNEDGFAAPGDDFIVQVPKNVGAISVFIPIYTITPPVGEQEVLITQEIPGTVLKGYDPFKFPGFIPLSPNTDFVRITNLGTGGDPTILFPTVAFGIDG